MPLWKEKMTKIARRGKAKRSHQTSLYHRWFPGVLGVFFLAVSCGQAPVELREYSRVGPFAFTERSGETVTDAEVLGRVCVFNFFFASCSAQCLKLSQNMARIQAAVRGMEDVRLVSVTVDPMSDTPENLRRYAASFHADPDQWYFLTGDRNKLYRFITEQFLLPAAESPAEAHALAGQRFIHSDKFAVVDRRGVVRAYVDGSASDAPEKILRIVKRLR